MPLFRLDELPAVLDAVLGRDVMLDDAAVPIRIARRIISGRDLFLVINDSPNSWRGALRFGQPGEAAELLNPTTGAIDPLRDPTRVELALDGWGAVVLRVSPAGRVPRLKPVGSSSGAPPEASVSNGGSKRLQVGSTGYRESRRTRRGLVSEGSNGVWCRIGRATGRQGRASGEHPGSV